LYGVDVALLVSLALPPIVSTRLQDDDFGILRNEAIHSGKHVICRVTVDAGVHDAHLLSARPQDCFELSRIGLARRDPFAARIARAQSEHRCGVSGKRAQSQGCDNGDGCA
jgi:hypothetical protein